MQQINKVTEGILWKEILLFFVPIFFSSFFQHLYSLVDGIVVGHYLGDIAFSAVGGSASKVSTLLLNFFIGVSTGITVYASRFFGEGNLKKVAGVVVTGTWLFIGIGLLLAALGYSCTPWLLKLQNTPEPTMADAVTYLRIFFLGLTFSILYNAFSGVLRALGDAKTSLYVVIFASLTNIVLDFVFVALLGYGVGGAALATLLAQLVSVLILGRVLLKRLPVAAYGFVPSFGQAQAILSLGLPAGAQSIMYGFSNVAIQSAVNTFGFAAVAAWAAYSKLDNIVDMFVSALAATVITFVGQNYGAGKFSRAKDAVKVTIVLCYLVIGILIGGLFLFKVSLLGLFTTSPEVIELGGKVMLVILPMYLLGIPYQICAQALRALGHTFVPMLITLVGIVGLRFFWVGVLFSEHAELTFLGLCYPLSSLLMSLIFVPYYLRVSRKALGA